MAEHNPGRRPVSLVESIKESTHFLLQRRGKTRTRAPDHPSQVREMKSFYNTGCVKRKRSGDTNGVATPTPKAPPAAPPSTKLYRLKNQQKANAWRSHQSITKRPYDENGWTSVQRFGW